MKQREERFRDFQSFYPFYLSEHANRTSRRLHFFGTGLVIATAIVAVVLQQWWLLWLLPLFGYGFAWTGHFFFEKNRPATFRYPLFSLAADFVMFRDILTGRIRF
ncbi:MAG: DUF962 domain-containing protein [Gammaproteobacteria bacterium]|nr:DUF962 domain-containing protein [Gammaproteobacteria bacterium]NNF61588.1 DUF962 domain-containing protein [Gammaproteobacteria bacterium]